jgi:hypothetical protein
MAMLQQRYYMILSIVVIIIFSFLFVYFLSRNAQVGVQRDVEQFNLLLLRLSLYPRLGNQTAMDFWFHLVLFECILHYFGIKNQLKFELD